MLYFFFLLKHNHYKLFKLKPSSLTTNLHQSSPLPKRIARRRSHMDKLVQPYDKEFMKMAMLKHEETFKEQVYELHRLYQVQKMLMKNIQSSRHKYKENIGFNNHQQQPAATKDHDHLTETFDDHQDIIEDESEIELTLAPTSFNRKRSMSNKSESSNSVSRCSSSSTSNNMQKIERITIENSSFLSDNRSRNNNSSDRSIKQPPWMYQALSLNMT